MLRLFPTRLGRNCHPSGARVRGRASLLPALIAIFVVIVASAALAVDEPVRAARERLDAIRGQFDLIEAVLDRPDNRSRGLSALREQVEPLRAELRQVVGTLEPLHGQIDSRVKQLGAPPAEGQPPEAPQVAADRKAQTTQLSDVDATLKQARLLSVRGDQIAERIDQQRRSSFANRFFARTDSPFNPDLWLQAASVVPRETGKLATHLMEWQEHLASRPTSLLVLALVFTIAALGAILLVRRFVRQRIYTAPPPTGETPLLPRSNKALFALRDTLLDALTAPAAVFAVVQIFGALGLLTDRAEVIGSRLVSAVFFVAIGRALANAVLAPGRPHRRLPQFTEDAARHLYNPIANTVLVTGAFLFVSGVNRALRIDTALSVSASALYAGIVGIILAYSLIVSRGASDERDGVPPWLRLTGWVAVIAIITALATGYVRLGSLIAERLVTAAVVLLALYLVLAIIDAVLGEGLTRDSPRRRALANTVGLRPKTLELFATLFAGLLRALSVLIALFIVVGTLTTSTIDLAGLLDSALLGVPVGQTRISVVDILIAVTIFLVGLLITRILYHWLSATVLPRTDLEASLQNSIATIFGYTGIIIAVALALARLGVNLENIALVAGALSIGIGFGLQSVVSNFVSGLILLTERPIRVGDWILAKGEEGYVRKISVRSTEIETSERAKVVLPNSDLITGVVKNWISADKLRAFTIAIGVSYDAEPDRVREVLLGVAGDNPRVAKHPAPSVLFVRFGESALEFELRGSVTDTDQRLGTMSDLHFDIFRRFREAGFRIPYPQRDIHIRSAPGGEEETAESEEAGRRPAKKR